MSFFVFHNRRTAIHTRRILESIVDGHEAASYKWLRMVNQRHTTMTTRNAARRLGASLCALWIIGQVLAWSHFSLYVHAVDTRTGSIVHPSHHGQPTNEQEPSQNGRADDCRVLGLLTQGALTAPSLICLHATTAVAKALEPITREFTLISPIDLILLSPSHSPPGLHS